MIVWCDVSQTLWLGTPCDLWKEAMRKLSEARLVVCLHQCKCYVCWFFLWVSWHGIRSQVLYKFCEGHQKFISTNHVIQEDHRGLTWNVVIENQWRSFQQCQNVLELHTSSLSTSSQLSVLKRPRIARQSIHRREAAMAIRRVPPTLPSALKARYLARALRRQGLCTKGSQAFRSLTGPCDQHWQALNIGRCEDFAGVQECIKVHEW